ncbi:MAG: flagellar hook-associated protein FlgK [Chitinispirillaceae bacterium]|nr:flagellar hook-associated protein FlgK [Chitinispirillaceae bacterium]
MGLFSVLNVGTRALFASQLAMDVAGQNISNADVEGYSRKRLNLSPDYRYDGMFGQMGIGVEVINIERMRNTFIDLQIQRQNREVGYYEELDYTMESIENIFTEPGDTGLLNYMDQFFDSWQNLSSNPSDLSARNMVKTNTEILVDVFHNAASELDRLRQTRNEEIESRVNKVNSICNEIFNLNKEIGAVEITNQNANDSRDKRDQLLKELSIIIDVDVIENEMGQVTITSAGSILVSPAFQQELETVSRLYTLSDGSTRYEVGIRFADSKRIYDPSGGQIKGLLESRDSVLPRYQQQIDELAVQFVEKINELHIRGYTLNGFSGVPFFEEQVTGARDIQLSAAVANNVTNIAAAVGGEALPADQNTSAAGTHNFGVAPIQLYRDPLSATPTAATNLVQGTVIVSTPSVTLTEGVDYHIDYANGTLQMLHAGYDADDLTIDFNYRTGGFGGPGDNANALMIAQLRTELTMNPDAVGEPTVTFAQYYSSFIGVLGLERNEASSNMETRQFLVDQYESHQDAIAGVSLDEEMANIIKYQHTYQAAARIISVSDEMLDVLMNM